MSKDFWLMWVIFLLFILFAAGMTAWGGYPKFAAFWVVSGIVGTLALAFAFRHDLSNKTEK